MSARSTPTLYFSFLFSKKMSLVSFTVPTTDITPEYHLTDRRDYVFNVTVLIVITFGNFFPSSRIKSSLFTKDLLNQLDDVFFHCSPLNFEFESFSVIFRSFFGPFSVLFRSFFGPFSDLFFPWDNLFTVRLSYYVSATEFRIHCNGLILCRRFSADGLAEVWRPSRVGHHQCP